MQQQVGQADVETLVLKLIAEATMPVGVHYVAKAIKKNWATTRAILLTLVADGRISVQRTSHGWYYTAVKPSKGGHAS